MLNILKKSKLSLMSLSSIASIASIGIGIGASVLGLLPKAAYAIEKPAYEVLKKHDGFEIRRYPNMLVARSTQENASVKKALNQGFREVADYIFGNNQAKVKIAMTAPVLENITSDNNANAEFFAKAENMQHLGKPDQLKAGNYNLKRHVYFVMPKSLSLNDISKPNNPRVELMELPSKIFAVKTHGYIWRTENIDKMKLSFIEELKAQKLVDDVAKAMPQTYIAIYNPPFTPPPFATNEVWVELNKY